MKIQFKGTKFFLSVIFVYLVLFFLDSDKTVASLEKATLVLFQLIPIFFLIILLTAAINYFLNPQHIVKYFGKESGIMSWVYALLGGIISHGPMYAWYPMIQDLKSHGLREGLITTFFYARAIKLPLLPLMIDYFGVTFTAVLSVYILLGAYVQGRLIEYLLWLKAKN